MEGEGSEISHIDCEISKYDYTKKLVDIFLVIGYNNKKEEEQP